MLNKFTPLFLLLSVLYFHANAQSAVFDKGYIIQKGDTIHGYIKNAPDIELSKTVHFKTNLNTEVATSYKPNEIAGFGFHTSNFHFTSVKTEIIKDGLTNQSDRFAKLMLSGYTSLYKLEIPEEEQSIILKKQITFLYVLKKDTTFYTLGVYESQSGDIVRTNKRYIGMLRAAFADCASYKDNLDRLDFNDKSILSEVIKYNSCKSPSTQNNIYQTKAKLVIKHGAEVSFATQNATYDLYKLNAKGYAAGYFWDIIQPDKSHKYSAKIGVNYMYYSYDYKEVNEDKKSGVYHIVRFPLAVQYNFKDALSSQTIPFLNVGFTAQITSGGTQSDLLPMPSVGLGLYHKRFRYTFLLENDGLKLSNPQILSFSVGMRLDK